MAEIRIDAANATPQQLLLAVYESQLRVESMMSELSQSVTDLQGAVDGVAQRLLPRIEELEAANGTLEAALSDALADDEQAQAALEDAKAATQAIREQVNELNSLGAHPDTPIDPNAPRPDNTLPGAGSEGGAYPDISGPGDQPYPDPRQGGRR